MYFVSKFEIKQNGNQIYHQGENNNNDIYLIIEGSIYHQFKLILDK